MRGPDCPRPTFRPVRLVGRALARPIIDSGGLENVAAYTYLAEDCEQVCVPFNAIALSDVWAVDLLHQQWAQPGARRIETLATVRALPVRKADKAWHE